MLLLLLPPLGLQVLLLSSATFCSGCWTKTLLHASSGRCVASTALHALQHAILTSASDMPAGTTIVVADPRSSIRAT